MVLVYGFGANDNEAQFIFIDHNFFILKAAKHTFFHIIIIARSSRSGYGGGVVNASYYKQAIYKSFR